MATAGHTSSGDSAQDDHADDGDAISGDGSAENDNDANDCNGTAVDGDDKAARVGFTGSTSTALSLQFACAVVYADRANQAHNTLMLLSEDYPPVCIDAAELPRCSKDIGQLQREYQEQHAEGKRHMAELLRHFSAEACGTSLSASLGTNDSGKTATVANATATPIGAANTEQNERTLNWQDREVLQDPTKHGRAMVWTERHRHAVTQMNHYFTQAMQTSKQLAAGGDTENDPDDDLWQHMAAGLGVEAGVEEDQAGGGHKPSAERERAVVCEWVHSLCDAGQVMDAKRKLKDLWAVLEGPVKDAHRALAALQGNDRVHSNATTTEKERQQMVMTEDGPASAMATPGMQGLAKIAGGHGHSYLSDSNPIVRDHPALNRWRGIDRETLECLEEEMSYLLLKAKLDEATPWPLSVLINAAAVDGDGALQEPQRPPSSLAAAEGYSQALLLAERISQHGPMIQCLKRPIPVGCFEKKGGRLRPLIDRGSSASILASGDTLERVLEKCAFYSHIGPQARVFRELSRSHLSLYDPAAAMACVQCLQLVSPPLEIMAADSLHRSTDELTGQKQPLLQLGPPLPQFSGSKTEDQTDSKSTLEGFDMNMRVLGPGSTISVALEDDDDDACTRRRHLFDVCAGAIVSLHPCAATSVPMRLVNGDVPLVALLLIYNEGRRRSAVVAG